MSFRNMPQPAKNEVLRTYNLRKNEFIQRLQAIPELVEVTYPDGGVYLGQLTADKSRSGKGIYTYPEGDIYFGSWQDDYFHGQGVYIHKNGEVYEGMVRNGQMEGKGTYYYSDSNAYYNGNWLNGQKHGEGLLYS